MFYGYENGGIEKNRKLLACSGANVELYLLTRDLYVIYDNNFAAEASLIGYNTAPEHARHIIFSPTPPFSTP